MRNQLKRNMEINFKRNLARNWKKPRNQLSEITVQDSNLAPNLKLKMDYRLMIMGGIFCLHALGGTINIWKYNMFDNKWTQQLYHDYCNSQQTNYCNDLKWNYVEWNEFSKVINVPLCCRTEIHRTWKCIGNA